MTGGPHIPVSDRAAARSDALIDDTYDEVSTNTHTHDRFGHAIGTEPLSQIGDVIASRYELKETLGVGAYGEVFKAWDTVRARIVAIKILRNTRANVLMQFKQEFRGVFELSHPNLVRVHKLGRDDSKWFIVMEFIDGVPITRSSQRRAPRTTISHLSRERTEPFAPHIEVQREPAGNRTNDAPNHTAPLVAPVFSLETLRDRIGQLVQGTYALHQVGIVHCDLKPSNILTSREGRVVILDFGASRYTMSLGAHYQHHWIRAGTRAYMAPEARTLRESTPGLDWYAVGVMLAEMLTGLHARVIASTPTKKRAMLLNSVAQNHPEYESLCKLSAHLMHPTPAERAGYKEAVETCFGDTVPQPIQSSRHRTPAFRIRNKELAALEDAYAVFQKGRPHAVVIQGASGSGKRTICREFLRRISLRSDAPHVLVAHCKQDELLSYRAFDGIVDGLSAILRALPAEELEPFLPFCTPTLCALFPTLRTVSPQLGISAETNAPQDALVGLQALLKRVADERRLVIWVSDIEQADRDSLRWIARIFAPGQRPNVFLLLTRIPHPTLPDITVDIDTLGYALPTISVKPLDVQSANSAIRQWLPSELANNDALVDAIRIASNGRIRTMHALCRFPSSTWTFGDDICAETLLDCRISSLDGEALYILQALAISFNAVGPQPLTIVTKQPPAHVDDILRHLLKEAFIVRDVFTTDERYELSDAMLRERVLHGMSDSLQQHLHDQYATAATAHTLGSIRPADVVAHLTHAKKYADAERYALAVATASEKGGAYDSAAKMFALLMELRASQGQPADADLRMRALECNLNSGRLLNAAQLLEQLAHEAENPDDASEFYQRAAETYNISGHFKDRNACSNYAREHRPQHARRYLPRLAHILLLLKRLKRRLKSFNIEDASQAPPTPSALSTLRTYRMAGFDIGIVDPVSGFEFALRELELALDSGSLIPISRALAGLSTFVSAMGEKHHAMASEWADLAVELAQAADDRTSLEWARVGQASTQYLDSNYRDAWTEIHASYQWLRENAPQQWMMLAYTSVQLIYIAYMSGRVDTLRSLYYGEIVEARAKNNRLIEAAVTFSGFITWLIDDAPEAGRAVLKRIDIPNEGKLYRLHDFFIAQYHAELCLYEQNIDAYPTHIQKLAAYERTVVSRSMELTRMAARFLRGRLSLAHATHTGKIRHKDLQSLHSLANGLLANEDLLVRGWGHQLLAGIYFIGDSHDRAAAHLKQTIELYNTAGISLYVEVVRSAARVTGLFPHSGDPYETLEQMGVVNPERFVRAHHPYI